MKLEYKPLMCKILLQMMKRFYLTYTENTILRESENLKSENNLETQRLEDTMTSFEKECGIVWTASPPSAKVKHK
jgi:hypothetical protein